LTPFFTATLAVGPAIFNLDYQIAKPSDEKITILIVTEYLIGLNAPGNDMMQRTRCVNSGLFGHMFV
jgi:hypothetical protein